MSLNQAVQVLQEMPLFRNVDPKQLRVVAMMGESLTYRAGERLFEKGDEGDAAFIIIGGEVEVLVPANGGEQSVAILGKGELFGELAVICDQARTTAIAARSELETLRLGRSVVLNLMREFPDINVPRGNCRWPAPAWRQGPGGWGRGDARRTNRSNSGT
jgi:CRP-like cAMP-binding protein